MLPLQEHLPLAPYTTFGIGGPARFFATITTEAALAQASTWARDHDIPLFLLGGGSNILVSDAGFPGLVLHIALRGITQEGSAFAAAAGEDWDALVTRTVEADCAGMECLAGIPGSVGGTPVQNVGAYGQEVSQTITEVRCYDRRTSTFLTLSNQACRFRYRESRFNTLPDAGRYIVTQVTFTLTPNAQPTLAYPDLQRHFAGREGNSPTLAEVAAAVRQIRRAKGMTLDLALPLKDRDPDTRSAGSWFKNPIVPNELYEALAHTHPALPSYPAGEGHRKLPAAWLLEQSGFPKGFSQGPAALSRKHTLALTNHSGAATAQHILALHHTLQSGVQARFGIPLHPEPLLIA